MTEITPTVINASKDRSTPAAATVSKSVRRMFGLSLHGWENWMIGSLWFAAGAAVIVGFSTWMVVKLQRFELRESNEALERYKLETNRRISDANSLTAEADARAKEAEARAKEAELALVKFRAPRLPTPEQLASLVERIKPFAGTKFDVGHSLEDREQMDFLWRLEPAISKAGWVHVDWVGGNMFVKPNWPGNHVYGQNPSINVGIELHPQSKEALTPAAEALVEALEAIEIEATITYFNTSSQNSDAVHVLVGPKR